MNLDDMKTPKGCRVSIKVEEPGFSDARILVKRPHTDVALEMRAGDSIEMIVKPWLVNQVVIEGLPREGDPEKPDGY